MLKKNKKKGFTLIELVMVIVLLGIIGAMGISFFTGFMNLFFFAPSQENTEMIGNMIADNVIEGNSAGKGIRIIKSITSADNTSIVYTDADQKSITLSWNNATKKISRTTPSGTQVLPPESPSHSVLLDGQTAGIIFKYFDAAGNQLASPVAAPINIARIKMDWMFYTGTGLVRNYDTKYLVNTGVYIKQF